MEKQRTNDTEHKQKKDELQKAMAELPSRDEMKARLAKLFNNFWNDTPSTSE